MAGYVEVEPGSSTRDRVCFARTLWIRQFGTSGDEQAHSMVVDGNGDVLVAGETAGALPGQSSAGGRDAFVRKYDAGGNELWTRQLGTSGDDGAYAVAVDSSGNVLVGGFTHGPLHGQTHAGGADAFLCKYDASGTLLWTRQLGSTVHDGVRAVSVDHQGHVFVAGVTLGALPGHSSSGSDDAFVRRYDANGGLVWSRQLGTSLNDQAFAVSADADGSVAVAGYTAGTLPGQMNLGGQDAFVRRYDGAGNELWTRQFGTLSDSDHAYGTSVSPDGRIFVAGATRWALPGQPHAGEFDAFVRAYDPSGSAVWTRQFGTSNQELAYAVSVDANDRVLVAGAAWAALPGQLHSGGGDAFVRTYDASGDVLSTHQLGSSADDRALSVSGHPNGIVVAGYTEGVLPGQTSAGRYDAFVIMLESP